MGLIIAILVFLLVSPPITALAGTVGYSITVTTSYALGDPFPNRIDEAFVEADTSYFQIANTGSSTFTGVVGDVAVSAFAGDLSFLSRLITLIPGASVSIAVPDDASNVGGFNGPAYFLRPGVKIILNGTISLGPLSEAVALLVADADIHSDVPRIDQYGLTSDSFVLQGGDPWGFDTRDDYELSQADGVYVLFQPAPEPGSASILAVGLTLAGARRSGLRRGHRKRQ